MSVFAAEKALWDITRDPNHAQAYRLDPEAFLARYRVQSHEAAWIRSLDVRALSAHGVSPMLLMQAWNTLMGADAVAEYLNRMNGRSSSQGANHG